MPALMDALFSVAGRVDYSYAAVFYFEYCVSERTRYCIDSILFQGIFVFLTVGIDLYFCAGFSSVCNYAKNGSA